ncbi:MAG: UDP-3-O-(3-hydroxymyristoyl)glucosamine N-acyltransferase [Candidatus Omnitrophica bacterium]|nr:UDP-3-O-(3-hydroxymyristoyl)glucosamine N-acyltransferase [Candidatus Omnitrophota bacterium]
MNLDIQVKDNSLAIVDWHDGGAGQIHSWIEKAQGYEVACFINPTDEALNIDPAKIKRDAKQFSYPTANSFKDKPLINSSDWVKVIKDLGIKNVLVTTDDPFERFEQINMARKEGLKLINAIHPSALIMEEAILHDNIILHARSFIGYRAELFPGSIVTSGHLDHHNVLRDCASVDPGAVCAGNVTVGAFSRLHTGAVVKNRIRIGENSIVGAGAVVIEDVPDNVTVVGVPARIIKQRPPHKIAGR